MLHDVVHRVELLLSEEEHVLALVLRVERKLLADVVRRGLVPLVVAVRLAQREAALVGRLEHAADELPECDELAMVLERSLLATCSLDASLEDHRGPHRRRRSRNEELALGTQLPNELLAPRLFAVVAAVVEKGGRKEDLRLSAQHLRRGAHLKHKKC